MSVGKNSGATRVHFMGRQGRAMRVAFASIVSLLLGVSFLVVPSAASAADATSFNAGNIISDGAMYNGGAMTAVEVQQFLNSRSGNCIIGTSGYAAGSTRVMSNGAIRYIANSCLPSFSMTTASKSADAYCGAYVGQANETAAQIIAKVGVACNISQKVLLVMLQKEQSLITDTWPYTRQYDAAMGYNCPDSGPNNSANCDPAYFGFQNQVYMAARQLQRYKALPNNYGYKAGQYNTVKWHPSDSCGTSNFYIENAATAGLYIYTPYRPNQAALNAGWGTGDGCSSYGNRNFFLYYSTWFGGPVLSVDSRLSSLYETAKSSFGTLMGNPVATGGGVYQELERATMAWHPSTGTRLVIGGIRTHLIASGGIAVTGFPETGEIQRGMGWTQIFQNAVITWTGSTGGVLVQGGIAQHYKSIGADETIGYPLVKERRFADGVWIQDFELGSLVWSTAAGSAVLQGGIREEYLARGAALAGAPIGQPVVTDTGMTQEFTKGTVSWTPAGGAFTVINGIRDGYRAFGGSAQLGYAVSKERWFADGVWIQDFELGSLVWSTAAGSAVLQGGIREEYLARGAALAGAPIGKPVVTDTGMTQEFTKGTVSWTPAGGAFTVINGIRDGYRAFGGSAQLGYAVSKERWFADGVWIQDFELGSLVWSTAAGSAVLQGGIREEYLARGAALAGAPIGKPVVTDTGMSQSFTRGMVTWTPEAGAIPVINGVLAGYLAYGGPTALGYALTREQIPAPGIWEQAFQGGVVSWQAGTGNSLRR